MYDVFNCTQAEGNACTVPPKWLAHMVAVYLSKVTGNVHDYDRASA